MKRRSGAGERTVKKSKFINFLLNLINSHTEVTVILDIEQQLQIVDIMFVDILVRQNSKGDRQ